MQKEIQSLRYQWIDLAKVLGIYLMILGHSQFLTDHAESFIYSFHMPLFFVISGLLYKPRPIRQELQKCWKSLLIPYILVNGICLLIWGGFECLHHTLSVSNILSRIIAIVLGIGYERWGFTPVCSPMWFFLAMFWCRLLMSLITHRQMSKKTLALIATIPPIVMYIMTLFDIALPWAISSSLMAMPFVIIAYVFKDVILKMNTRIVWNIVASSIGIILLFVLWKYNCAERRCDIDALWWGRSLILFYVTAFIGTISFCSLCKLCNRGIEVAEIISTGTVPIVGFHMIIAYQLSKFIPSNISLNGNLIAMIVSLIVLALLIPVVIVCKRYFRIILGNR